MENNNNEPIVLGTLKKEKSSKPVFVFIVLGILIASVFAIPYVEDYLQDPDTLIGKIYTSIFGEEEIDEEETIIPEDSHFILNNKTNINFNNLNLTNISLNDQTITYNLKARNNNFDLDADNYYLEIYGSNKNLLERIKLSGNLTSSLEERTFTFKDLRFNSGISYYGKLIILKDEDYNEIILSTDESGIASITCQKSGDKYEYIFDDYLLKRINHTLTYTDTSNLNLYLALFEEYTNLTNNIKSLGHKASINENNEGFIFEANLDLESLDNNLNNSYYYSFNKQAKIINYDMKLEGFICN
ncbi:MAG: hypothetical protein PHS24_04150 [Bacilli bacterium]|nr:hypothetical protein [Bacilli bacterium]